MTPEQYHGKYEYNPVPDYGSPTWTQEWQDDWDSLGRMGKEKIKQMTPFFVEPGERAQFLERDWWSRLEEGPDTNIWKGLSEALGIPAGAVKKWGMGLLGELRKGTDFAEEYGVGKQALDQQLREARQKTYKGQAARGLLDSSATAAQLGGAEGGYSNALAALMQWKGSAEEQSRQFNLGTLGRMTGQGMDFAKFLNTQYMQDMGMRGEALKYLQGNRAMENQFNLQAGQQWGWDPMTGGDLIGPGLEVLAASQGAPGMDFDFGGGGSGGGGNRMDFTRQMPPWEQQASNLNQQWWE